MVDKQKTILFLCTGNYYRSRFVEALFNRMARERGLAWRAESAGLRVSEHGNIGALSVYAREAMVARGLAIDERMPRSLRIEMLQGADRVIVLSRAEHEPMMAELFPEWKDHVTYWEIGDIQITEPKRAIEAMERNVVELIDELS